VQGSLTLSAGGAHSLFFISGTTRGAGPQSDGYDGVDVSGDLTLGGSLDLTLFDGFTPGATDEYTLMTSSLLSGSFSNVASGGTVLTTDGLGAFTVYYGVGSPYGANDVVLSDFTSVPEPGPGLLIGVGMLGLLAVRRRGSAKACSR
jgi:hypothetical protein